MAESLAAKLASGGGSDENMKVTVASVCALFGLLKYDHEKEKMVVLLARRITRHTSHFTRHTSHVTRHQVVLLARHIADPENREEFRPSMNDWDEVARAFGSATEAANAAVPAAADAAAEHVIPNLISRLSAEKVASQREKHVKKVLEQHSDLKCTCSDIVELLQALRYDHEKLLIYQAFIPRVTDPAKRQTVLQLAPAALRPEFELLFPMEARAHDGVHDDAMSDLDARASRPGSAASAGSGGSGGGSTGGTSHANSVSRKEMENLAKLRSVKGKLDFSSNELTSIPMEAYSVDPDNVITDLALQFNLIQWVPEIMGSVTALTCLRLHDNIIEVRDEDGV